jgi:hypothetical protein
MKKNPEALMGIADQQPSIGEYGTSSLNIHQPFDSTKQDTIFKVEPLVAGGISSLLMIPE